MLDGRILTVPEVGRLLRISEPVAYGLVRSRKIPLGRLWRVSETALQRFLEAGGDGGGRGADEGTPAMSRETES